MIEIFKTNVTSKSEAKKILQILNCKFPNYKINFDLEDCDNILRIENKSGILEIVEIISILSKMKIEIKHLKD